MQAGSICSSSPDRQCKPGRRRQISGRRTLPTMTLVQKGSMAEASPAVTRPPGGQNAQHLMGTLGSLRQSRQIKLILQNLILLPVSVKVSSLDFTGASGLFSRLCTADGLVWKTNLGRSFKASKAATPAPKEWPVSTNCQPCREVIRLELMPILSASYEVITMTLSFIHSHGVDGDVHMVCVQKVVQMLKFVSLCWRKESGKGGGGALLCSRASSPPVASIASCGSQHASWLAPQQRTGCPAFEDPAGS